MLQNHNLKVDEHDEAHSNEQYIFVNFRENSELLDDVITFYHKILQLVESRNNYQRSLCSFRHT